jgi:DNA-binding LacI/PurR family transcriptional regulator
MTNKRKNGAGRLTIKDVAQEAGVSIGTVSGVLNDNANVASGTRDHVEAVMKRLGYEPNSSARAMRRQRVSTIGVIMPDLRNSFFSQLAEGVERGISEHDILMSLCLSWSDPHREEYFAQLLRGQRLDGVIYLSGTGLPSPSLIELTKTGTVVFVDEVLPGIDCPSVLTDNRRGARDIARAVAEAGHRRIAVVEGPERLWTADQRLSGFREGLVSCGVDPDGVTFVPGDYTEGAGYRAGAALTQGSPDTWPTAVICANDQSALGLIRFCREAGISVPKALSVTGYDDIAESVLMSPALTTVAQPAHDMGRAAAHLLLYSIGVRDQAPETIRFGTEIRLRDSLAPPAS